MSRHQNPTHIYFFIFVLPRPPPTRTTKADFDLILVFLHLFCYLLFSFLLDFFDFFPFVFSPDKCPTKFTAVCVFSLVLKFSFFSVLYFVFSFLHFLSYFFANLTWHQQNPISYFPFFFFPHPMKTLFPFSKNLSLFAFCFT